MIKNSSVVCANSFYKTQLSLTHKRKYVGSVLICKMSMLGTSSHPSVLWWNSISEIGEIIDFNSDISSIGLGQNYCFCIGEIGAL